MLDDKFDTTNRKQRMRKVCHRNKYITINSLSYTHYALNYKFQKMFEK